MALPCEQCGHKTGVIYCQIHATRLCVFCDILLHAADKVSLTHARAPVCHQCHNQAAVVRYLGDSLVLCASCNCKRVSCSSIPAPRHRPVRSYTGCSWEQMLASLLGTPDDPPIQLPSPKDAGVGIALETADNHYCPSESFAAWEDPSPFGMGGVVGDLKHYFITSNENMVLPSSSMLPPPDCSTDLPPLPPESAFELNHPEASTSAQDCFNFQSANNLQPFNAMPINAYPRFPGINSYSASPFFKTENEQPICPLSQLNLARGSRLFDSWSRELSSVLHISESNWGLNVMSRQTSARETAVKRYREKRDNRSPGTQVKYPLRKARADARKRVKGRFAKEGETCTNDQPPTPPGETPEPDQTHHS